MEILLSTLNAKFVHSSLALNSLAAYCSKNNNCTITIKEYSVNNEILAVLSDICSARADVIGFACYIWNIEMTLKLVSLLKKVMPEVVIVLGGPEVSYDSEQVMKFHTVVDYVVMGEGEEILSALITALQDRIIPENINGLAYRKANQIVVQGGPQTVNDLNSIPFAYSYTEIEDLRNKIIYYESSRGCPFSCKYCLSSTTHGVRYRALESVMWELAFLAGKNVKQIKFVDRTFNARREHFLPILKFLAALDCTTNFHFEINADILEEEVLDLLAAVPPGRFQFEIGVQSTYEPALLASGRRNNWQEIAKNVTRLRSFTNIHLHLDLIVGLPYESFMQFGSSFNDVYGLQPDMLQVGFLKLLKGSAIREYIADSKYLYMDNPPYEVLGNKYITYEEIRRLKVLENMVEYYYNSAKLLNTLCYLVSVYKGNAYKLFNELAEYWDNNHLNLLGHSTRSLFEHFYRFAKENIVEQMEAIRELLKLDALLCERGAIRPEALNWNNEKWSAECNAFWRDNSRIDKYLPGYKFTNWRDIKKNFHIEVFECNVLDTKTRSLALTPVLVSYNNAYPRYQLINSGDFFISEDHRSDAL